MDTETKVELIRAAPTEEILTEEDLRQLVSSGETLRHYIGFEISGLIHLGTGLMTGAKIADLQKAGISCSIYLASWHAWINNKLGGDFDFIRKVAVGYFKEGMKISCKVMGADPSKIKFITGDELYHNNDKYWETVIDVSKNLTLSRVRKSITIMGRKLEDEVSFAQLIYPPMQVADIFIQGLNLAHSGMDQRKAHVIAREVALKLKSRPLLNKQKQKTKPIAIHHHLILGLGKPPVWPVPKDRLREVWSSMKMSKSIPSSAVFIHDSPEEINKKLTGAFCPAGEVEFNPVLDWAKNICFRNKRMLLVKRPAKFGGDKSYSNYEALEGDFKLQKLHPMDLKGAVAESLINLLAPARKHFAKPKYKAMLDELYAHLKQQKGASVITAG